MQPPILVSVSQCGSAPPAPKLPWSANVRLLHRTDRGQRSGRSRPRSGLLVQALRCGLRYRRSAENLQTTTMRSGADNVHRARCPFAGTILRDPAYRRKACAIDRSMQLAMRASEGYLLAQRSILDFAHGFRECLQGSWTCSMNELVDFVHGLRECLQRIVDLLHELVDFVHGPLMNSIKWTQNAGKI
jgi:hypothetical protein